MNAQLIPTTADLNDSRRVVEAELQEARQAHASAAYAAAVNRDDQEARTALLDAKRRMDLLSAELEGLSAATGEARRREEKAALLAQLGEVERQRRDSVAAADAVLPAFERTRKLIEELGAAWKELQAAERSANEHETRRAMSLYAERRPHDLYTPAYRIEPLVDGLLWQHIGRRELDRSDLVMDVGGRFDDAPLRRALERMHDRAVAQIDRGADHSKANLQKRADAIQA